MQITFAQERTVSGTVTDQGGLPLPGVNVVIRGTTTGVSTDFDGRFSIEAAPTDILVFSFIGMQTRELPATSTTINVTMQDVATQLETVVVTAVGIRREKASIGAATTTVRSEQIVQGSQPNIADALKGKVAGVVISNASTDPGASSGILIRGISSLSQENQPLFVVDGIPINNQSTFSSSLNGGYDFGRGSGDINPDDIASLTVLKGASATALYGSRAANGVIIITTKKGQAGKLAIDFSTTTFFSEVLRTPKYQNQFGQGWDGIHYLNENGSWGPRFDNQVRPWGNVVDNSQLIKRYAFQEDQLENFFDTGISTVNTLSVSGGAGESTVRLSYSNTQQDGIYPTNADSFERNTIGLSGTTKVGGFTLNGNMNYVNTAGSAVATGQGLTVYNNLLQIPNDIPITEFRDYNSPFHNVSNYYTPYGVTNPYFTLNENGSDYNKERFYGSLEISAEINKWSSFTYRAGVDVFSELLRTWTAEVDAAPGSPNNGQSSEAPGTYSEVSNTFKQINHDLLYNLNFEFTDKLALASTFGFNLNTRGGTSFAASVPSQDIQGFYSFSNSADVPTVSSARSDRKLYGLFNSSTLSYDNQIYLTVNARNDWFSTLPEQNRSFFYGGANVSWVFTNTFPGLKNIMDYGKLRGGYGESGNDTAPYQVNSIFALGSADNQGFGSYNFPVNQVTGYEVGNRLENPDLRPERKKEFEIGLEASFFDNRLSIDATYYNARVVDQILSLPLAPSSGYTSQTANIGTISNEGFEALVTFGWIKNNEDGFNWSTSVNFTTNNTVLEELDPRLGQVELGGLSTTSLIAKEGQPVGLIIGSVPERDPNGNIVVDVNGIPVASSTREVYGDTQYDYTMGIGNTLSYKGLSLDFTFDIRQGGLMYSRTADITRFTGNSVTTTFNNREPFIVPGSVVRVTDAAGNVTYQPNTTPVDVEHMDDYYRADALSRQNVIDKSFIKLREVVLTYALPAKYLEKSFIQGLSFSVIGRNLFLWTPRSNQYIDPEVSTFGTDLQSQFGEFSANPSTRSMGFAIRANF
ncbi:TonB-dependent receptor [Flavobacterium cyanobacteriorum]|uniref:TonB-dependent receptor n=2 Tax=Flavobacterium cyanobacteriorum TaxID=2022802 RepID=A0A255Z9Y9_9FLAO|nr:TonB-dependent receptor [Flavobacterium cyanobacteriorum]